MLHHVVSIPAAFELKNRQTHDLKTGPFCFSKGQPIFHILSLFYWLKFPELFVNPLWKWQLLRSRYPWHTGFTGTSRTKWPSRSSRSRRSRRTCGSCWSQGRSRSQRHPRSSRTLRWSALEAVCFQSPQWWKGRWINRGKFKFIWYVSPVNTESWIIDPN